MCIHCIACVLSEAFVDDLEGEHGILPDVVPDALREMEKHVHEAFALNAEPAEALDAHIEIGELMLIAIY